MLKWFEKIAPIRRKFDILIATFLLHSAFVLIIILMHQEMRISPIQEAAFVTGTGIVFLLLLTAAKELICRPYIETVIRMEEIAAGYLDAPIIHTDHEDCVGRMTSAMQTFKENAAQLLYNSTHNLETNLLNMEGLRRHFPTLVARARLKKCNLLVGVVDLDNLKLVNDTLGHSVGDALIAEAAKRLSEEFCEDAAVARLGGDEFVFVQACNLTEDARADRLKRLEIKLNQPCLHEGRSLDCSASTGIAFIDPDSADLDELLRSADLAMYCAKEAGKGSYAFFSPEMLQRVKERVASLDFAKLALGSKLVIPFYQPQVCLKSGEVVGYEALLRVRIHNNILPPATIADAFDNCDLATRLGDEMLRRVLEQMRIWKNSIFDFGSVAINASASELLREDYADRVLEALHRADVKASKLEIEVTEGVVIGRGAERCARTLETLRKHGVGIALDDFGTGYASLTHVKSLPITKLKIDRSFVHDLTKNTFDATIVRSLVQLAEVKGATIVAEGVETLEQATVLRRLGCPIGQGFLFGAAVAGADVANSLVTGRTHLDTRSRADNRSESESHGGSEAYG